MSFIDVLLYYGDDVTREAYLEAAYLGRPPAELGAECESELPEPLQRWDDEEDAEH